MSDTNSHDAPEAPRNNLGSLADDIGHPFDQTNGIVEGLDGDANDPEVVDEHIDGPAEGGVQLVPGGTGYMATPGSTMADEQSSSTDPITEEASEEEAP